MWRTIKLLLLGLCAVHMLSFGILVASKLQQLDGLLTARHEPVAGDFINLYTAGRLLLHGQGAKVYVPEAFMGEERTVIPETLGVRLWAYPPTSLIFAWPFGAFGFWASLVLWSVFGLVVLALGARRMGLDWMENAILLMSPGAMHSVYFGQTGNLMTGLLLLALSARRGNDRLSIVSAALLTIKPQIGFLLPLLWGVQRRWGLIGYAAVATLVLAAVSVALFGPGIWNDYLFDTLPLLGRLEREATGFFMYMIPSTFMAGRVLGLEPNTALLIHAVVAVATAAVLVWRLLVVRDPMRQAAMVLLAMPLISPYLHSYDLALLAAGALLAGRSLVTGRTSVPGLGIGLLIVGAWGLPNFLLRLNQNGVPISPLGLGALFLVAALMPERQAEEQPAIAAAAPQASA